MEFTILIATECLRKAGEVAPGKAREIYENKNKFRQLVKNKTVHFLALFIMVYVGAEVTIRGIIRHLT
jgi:fucose permease